MHSAVIWLLLFVTGLSLLLTLAVHMLRTEPERPAPWSPEALRAAKAFWEESIPNLQVSGSLAEPRTEDQCLVLPVTGEVWKRQDVELRKYLLLNASSSREILAQSSCVEIRDDHSGQVYGSLKPPALLTLAE